MIMNKILKTFAIDKVLNDETLAPLLENKLKEYPLGYNEKKNVLVIEVEKDIIYATVCGRGFDPIHNRYTLSYPKEQKKLIPLLKELITLAKKG
jgi:hypothetical protein